MSLLKRLLGREPPKPPLPPLHDPVLGELQWNPDSDGWVGHVAGSDGSARVQLGGGSAHAYPPAAMLALLREPYPRFASLERIARDYLAAHADAGWRIEPATLLTDALETYEPWLADLTWAIAFSHPASAAIWSVQFRDGLPISHTVDD